MGIPFWFNDPTVLLNKNNMYKIWPNTDMTHEEKLNSITRLVIIATIVGYILTNSTNLVISSVVTLISIIMLYKFKKTDEKDLINKLETDGFTGHEAYEELKDNFEEPTSNNPLQNLEPTKDNVDKKPAAPSFNPVVNEKINEAAKQQIKDLHKDFPDIDKNLFRDLGEHENFENSMRPFYSMPNTRTPNDQKSFSNFCYGDMTSKKEENEILIENKF